MPKVSVIIPVYNCERHIREAITRFLYGEQARCSSDLGKFLVKEGQVHEGRKRLAESIRLGARGWDLPIAIRSFCRLARSFV